MSLPLRIRRSRSAVACLVVLIFATLASVSSPPATAEPVTANYRLLAPDVTLLEGDAGVTTDFAFEVTVQCSGTSSLLVGKREVRYTTLNGTGSRAALKGTDYKETFGTLVFDFGTPPTDATCSAQRRSATVHVPVFGNTTPERHKHFFLELTGDNGDTGEIVGTAPILAKGTILNDDGPSVSIADASVTRPREGATPMSFSVTLSEAVKDTAMSVDYELVSGTAQAGQDYAPLTGASESGVPNTATLMIPPGKKQVTVDVPVYGDTLNAADQTFGVRLFNPDFKEVTRSLATGTIVTKNPVPALAVSDAWVVEGSGATAKAVFKVSLPPPFSKQTVTVNYATEDGTATAGEDYTATTGTVSIDPFLPSGTIVVPLTADSAPERNETFSLVLSDPVGATMSRPAATGTIVNDDGQAFALAVSGSPVSGEKQTVTVTAKASFAPGAVTDATYLGTPVLSAPDDTHFAPGECGLAVAGVSTCRDVVFGDLGPKHLVATDGTAGGGALEPNGTTLLTVAPTALVLAAAADEVPAGFPLRFTATPVAGVSDAVIDGYGTPRSLTVAGGPSSPRNGSALSCPGSVCAFDVTFPGPGPVTVKVSDGSRTSAALAVKVTEATAAPPGRPAGELPLPLVAKLDLFDSAGTRIPDGQATTLVETTVDNPPPTSRNIANLMAVDAPLRLLLATGQASPQVTLINLDSLGQVGAIPLNFGTPAAPLGPRQLVVDPIRHLGFATDGVKLATFALGEASVPNLFTLPAQRRPPPSVFFATRLAVSPKRGVVYVLSNEADSVTVRAYDADKLAAGDAAPELWSHAVSPLRCYSAPHGLAVYEGEGRDSFLYFYCRADPTSLAANYPAKQDALARLTLGAAGSTPPGSTEFVPLPTAQAASEILSPFDGRLTLFGRQVNTDLPWTGKAFDAAHAASLGPKAVTARGASPNGAAQSADSGRSYLFASGELLQAPNPILGGRTERKIVPTSLTVSEAGRLPADNGVAHPTLDGYVPFDGNTRLDAPPASAFDPVTRRIFLFGSGYTRPTDRFVQTGANSYDQVIQTLPSHPVFVFQDRIADAAQAEAPDPDADTHDEPEVPGRTPVAYSAGASAYGAVRRSFGGPVHFSTDNNTENRGASTVRSVTSAHVISSGLSDSGASATAVGTVLDEATAKQMADGGGPPPGMEDQFVESHCGDFGGAPRTETRRGSSVTCNLATTTVRASATEDALSDGAPPGSDAAMQVGSAEAKTTLTRDPVKGSVARAEAVARNVVVGGVVHIGEVRSVATSVANGRKGKASSTFSSVLSQVVLTNPDGSTAYACEDCDPTTVADAINGMAGTNLVARAGAPDPNPLVAGSPGGAQAATIKAPYDYWHDFYTYGDETQQVYALEIYADRSGSDLEDTERGLLLQLAGVTVDAHYVIGETPPEPEVVPGSLKVALFDGEFDAVPLPAPLAGGAFEVHRDSDGDGVLGAADPLIPSGSCVTAEDGTGTCLFLELAPGAYVVHEKSPPPGYAGSEDAKVTITSANRTVLNVFNPKAVARVRVALTDTADPPQPLAGGVFELFADDGDGVVGAADVLRGTCTTAASGACPDFVDVPLGAYVVHEKTPPPGYLGAPDAAFALTKPGELAESEFVNPKGVGSVVVAVSDDTDPPQPLAGGVFELYADDGDGVLGAADRKLDSCTSAAEGLCSPFLDVPLGKYVVHEKTPPPGYLGAPDVAFSLTKAQEVARAAFVNPKAVGRVEISLADDATPPQPLGAGAFELYADDGDGVLDAADVLRGSCTTTASGACPAFLDVPFGTYVVYQKTAPAGYVPADDATFSLTKAGEVAQVAFVNPKAVGRVEVSLADDATPPQALGGGVFELFADDGDGVLDAADVLRGSCTTTASGACPAFLDVPFGDYVVHQKAAPPGYVGAPDDPTFSLTKPAETAQVGFVNPRAIGRIEVSVSDDATPPKPLAGGVFELFADDGDGVLGAADVLRGSCTTTASGACPAFVDVPLGAYVVHEKTAPPGYAAADDAAFALTKPAETAEVGFVNPRAIGRIEISLTNTATPPKPLGGGVFELYADDGDGKLGAADRKVGSCTTDAAGLCPPFLDVPLGAYVVHQQAAPEGYEAADDVAFALREPGQTIAVEFVDGTPGTAAVAGTVTESDLPSEETSGTPARFIPGEAAAEPSYTEVVVLPGTEGPEPIVSLEPTEQAAAGPGGFFAPVESARRFLARTPMQSLLFALVWLLLGMPVYLGTRRYRLSRVREGI